jgi:hypothetical protein
MTTPEWIREVLAAFDSKAEPHGETEIAQALEAARAKQGDLSEEGWRVYLAEHSAFLLRGVPETQESYWGTYFGPMVVIPDAGIVNPDITKLDAETVIHWEQRAKEARDPVMVARYADASWDWQEKLPT